MPTLTDTPEWDYKYNANGDPLSGLLGSYSYNSANQITNPGYSYDANGNLTATPALPNLTYNSRNQTTAITPTGQAPTSLSYAGSGQAGRTTAGDTTFVNGLVMSNHQTTPSGITYYERDADGTLIAEHGPDGEYFYATDGTGSVTALVDTSGQVAATYTYSPLRDAHRPRRPQHHGRQRQPLPLRRRLPRLHHQALPLRRPLLQPRHWPVDPTRPNRHEPWLWLRWR